MGSNFDNYLDSVSDRVELEYTAPFWMQDAKTRIDRQDQCILDREMLVRLMNHAGMCLAKIAVKIEFAGLKGQPEWVVDIVKELAAFTHKMDQEVFTGIDKVRAAHEDLKSRTDSLELN